MLSSAPYVLASETNAITAAPKFLGAQSCSTSGCHGGAGELSKQFTIWAQYDFHHQRPVATLTTARSERLASVLKIADPTKDARCTSCHAPFQTVPAALLDKAVKVTEGVSCESCHGRGENWLLSHTRKDYTYTDRVHAGMRDLKNPYVRANTCVACHQNVDSDMLRAGHPELIFELDGQAVTQPKHWRKELDKPGPQLWLVGQLVALREMSWLIAQEKSPDDDQVERWAGLLWVIQHVRASLPESIAWPREVQLAANPVNADTVRGLSDAWARVESEWEWSDGSTEQILKRLAQTYGEFLAPRGAETHARRAERLVLALDRLTQASRFSKDEKVSLGLNRLFEDVQSLPDFDPLRFAADLKVFYGSVSGLIESKWGGSSVHERPHSP